MSERVTIQRLGPDDTELARVTFRLMVEVFEEGAPEPLSEAYLRLLLARPEFCSFSALDGDVPVGGITAHEIAMTRSAESELFIYDIAVHPSFQRKGIGRSMVGAVRAAASIRGIRVALVPADREDDHALAFYRALGGSEADVSIFTFE